MLPLSCDTLTSCSSAMARSASVRDPIVTKAWLGQLAVERGAMRQSSTVPYLEQQKRSGGKVSAKAEERTTAGRNLSGS
jgi:hypothetical protein